MALTTSLDRSKCTSATSYHSFLVLRSCASVHLPSSLTIATPFFRLERRFAIQDVPSLRLTDVRCELSRSNLTSFLLNLPDLFGQFSLDSFRRSTVVTKLCCSCQNPKPSRTSHRMMMLHSLPLPDRDLVSLWYASKCLQSNGIFSAGCIYSPIDMLATPLKYQVLQLERQLFSASCTL